MSEGSKKLGIENLKPYAFLAFEMGNVADKFGRTKGIGRWMTLADLFDEVVALKDVKIDQVLAELKDLDSAERAELHKAFEVKFDIVDDNLESVIEDGLKIVEEAFSLVDRSISLIKSLKK